MESEQESDPDEAKHKTFEVMLDLMQKVSWSVQDEMGMRERCGGGTVNGRDYITAVVALRETESAGERDREIERGEGEEKERNGVRESLLQAAGADVASMASEQESDPDDVKRKRFEVVLDLMQNMQDLGQPPTELVGDIAAPPAGFAPPVGGNDPSQCALM
ncbi:hypothetical protein MSG28_015316 [Choristoneura fumiferana]|uniref:Uncharacterized protein n=1 Tax=Choristoneura fumiferana TaxID=7141 RepID=A0ACC0KAD0_CHOFU|nr:hypothetical protein MSG28_015316 [Choristoneura fumiferana]